MKPANWMAKSNERGGPEWHQAGMNELTARLETIDAVTAFRITDSTDLMDTWCSLVDSHLWAEENLVRFFEAVKALDDDEVPA